MNNQQTKPKRTSLSVPDKSQDGGYVNLDKTVDTSARKETTDTKSSGAYFKDKIAEIEKGCDRKLNNGFEYSTCGEWSEIHKQPNYLCRSCRAKLSIIKDAQEQVKKVIDEFKNSFDQMIIDDQDANDIVVMMDKEFNITKEKLGIN